MSDSDSSITTKTCTKCGGVLPKTLEYFNRHRMGRDGLASWCRDCTLFHKRQYRESRREELRLKQKEYAEKNPSKVQETKRKYYEAHQDQVLASAAKYRDENREEICERGRERYRENREERIARSAEYRKEHLEEMRAKDRERYAANREAQQARRLAYYWTHYDEMREQNRQWIKANPEKCRAKYSKRRALERGNGGGHTGADITAQYERQSGRCFYCGKKVGEMYHVDHVVPLSKGGSNGPENIVIACPPCNLSKHAKHPMDFCGKLL